MASLALTHSAHNTTSIIPHGSAVCPTMRSAFVFAALLAVAAAANLRSTKVASNGQSVAAKNYGWTDYNQCDSAWGTNSMGSCGDICYYGCAMT